MPGAPGRSSSGTRRAARSAPIDLDPRQCARLAGSDSSCNLRSHLFSPAAAQGAAALDSRASPCLAEQVGSPPRPLKGAIPKREFHGSNPTLCGVQAEEHGPRAGAALLALRQQPRRARAEPRVRLPAQGRRAQSGPAPGARRLPSQASGPLSSSPPAGGAEGASSRGEPVRIRYADGFGRAKEEQELPRAPPKRKPAPAPAPGGGGGLQDAIKRKLTTSPPPPTSPPPQVPSPGGLIDVVRRRVEAPAPPTAPLPVLQPAPALPAPPPAPPPVVVVPPPSLPVVIPIPAPPPPAEPPPSSPPAPVPPGPPQAPLPKPGAPPPPAQTPPPPSVVYVPAPSPGPIPMPAEKPQEAESQAAPATAPVEAPPATGGGWWAAAGLLAAGVAVGLLRRKAKASLGGYRKALPLRKATRSR